MHEPLPQKAYRALQRHDSRLRRAAGMHGATTADAWQAPADLRREVPRLRCAAGMHAAAPAWEASAALPCQRACLQGTAAMHTTAHAPHAHATAAIGMHSGPRACWAHAAAGSSEARQAPATTCAAQLPQPHHMHREGAWRQRPGQKPWRHPLSTRQGHTSTHSAHTLARQMHARGGSALRR